MIDLQHLDLLQGKIEKALDTIRQLRTDKSVLSAERDTLSARIAELEGQNGQLRNELEEKDLEVMLMKESMQERDSKMQVASERLERVMRSLESELGSADAQPSAEAQGFLEFSGTQA